MVIACCLPGFAVTVNVAGFLTFNCVSVACNACASAALAKTKRALPAVTADRLSLNCSEVRSGAGRGLAQPNSLKYLQGAMNTNLCHRKGGPAPKQNETGVTFCAALASEFVTGEI